MSLIPGMSMDGCDTYLLEQDVVDAGWIKTGTITPGLTDGRRNGGSLHMSVGDQMARDVAYTDVSAFLQMHMYLTALPASELTLFEMKNNSGADQNMRVTLDATGIVRLYDAADALVDTSASGIGIINAWQTWEFGLTPSDTGTVEMKVDASTIANVSPEDFTLGANDCDFFRITGVAANSRFDDMIWNDSAGSANNDFLGDRVVYSLQPNADGTETDWTQNGAGTDSGCIGASAGDVIPGTHDSDTTYLSATGASPLGVTVNLEGLPAGVQTVDGVQVRTAAKKDDGGSLPAASRVRALLRHSGSVTTGATVSYGLTTSYLPFFDTFEDVPGGSGWTRTQVDALEAGTTYEQPA